MKEKHDKNGNGRLSSVNMVFGDNRLLPMLFGEDDAHLSRIEKKFNVSASSRGNVLALAGEKDSVDASRAVIERLYSDLEKGGEVGMAQDPFFGEIFIRTQTKKAGDAPAVG